MKILQNIFNFFLNNKKLSKFHPVFEAGEEIFFGTSKIIKDPPFISDYIEIKRYMTIVIFALLPPTAASIYFFGLKALYIILTAYVAGAIVEVAFGVIRKKGIHEGFLVTGLIFPLTLPPTTPLWVVAVGVMIGTLFGKEVFGGTGRNIFNPALTGRLFITIAFPGIMSTAWQIPFTDTITAASPLVLFKSQQIITEYKDLLLGTVTGSMGETFRIGIIASGLLLMFTKVSNWRVPVAYLGTVALLSFIGYSFLPEKIAPPMFQLLSGGLLFGAMFMATDPVTSPYTRQGKIIFGIGCGIFTLLIRSFSGYVEGVMFSIVLMNALAPIIDHAMVSIKYKRVDA